LRRLGGRVRFYNAGSSECFGDTGTRAANEHTAFRPKSPYGVAKAAAISLVANYRESYGLFASSGLLFNYESPLRPIRFVTGEIMYSVGDPTKAAEVLGWRATVRMPELVARMVRAEQDIAGTVSSAVS